MKFGILNWKQIKTTNKQKNPQWIRKESLQVIVRTPLQATACFAGINYISLNPNQDSVKTILKFLNPPAFRLRPLQACWRTHEYQILAGAELHEWEVQPLGFKLLCYNNMQCSMCIYMHTASHQKIHRKKENVTFDTTVTSMAITVWRDHSGLLDIKAVLHW